MNHSRVIFVFDIKSQSSLTELIIEATSAQKFLHGKIFNYKFKFFTIYGVIKIFYFSVYPFWSFVSLVGQMISKNVYVLISKTRDYIILQGKRDFKCMTKLRM